MFAATWIGIKWAHFKKNLNPDEQQWAHTYQSYLQCQFDHMSSSPSRTISHFSKSRMCVSLQLRRTERNLEQSSAEKDIPEQATILQRISVNKRPQMFRASAPCSMKTQYGLDFWNHLQISKPGKRSDVLKDNDNAVVFPLPNWHFALVGPAQVMLPELSRAHAW